VPPKRPKNAEVRGREYLTPGEVVRLAKAAAGVGRHGRRDALLILMASTHGLRVSELVGLRRDQVDLDSRTPLLHVRRRKRGVPSTHPLRGAEVRELRWLYRNYPASSLVFVSERGGGLDRSTVQKIVARAGERAGLGFPVHPHMLRHACGFKLANEGRDTRAIQLYLGHRNIQHTVRYTELSAERFTDFWDD
jgi:type 1 fimbriae regulatory protein FimB/type 1 fimbriae regulatory protein FimE